MRLVSIGHSNHDWPSFVALLHRVGVTVLADVRSSPFSSRYPYFNREPLARGLGNEGIGYIFLGSLLGGRPAKPSLYDEDGRVNYERVRRTEAFEHGLEQLTKALDFDVMAFLCSEEDPLQCHRGLMISPALNERGFRPHHLRRDGRLESNAQMEHRLMRETGIGAGILDGLFAATLTEEERRSLLSEAYRCQARRKVYQLPPDLETE